MNHLALIAGLLSFGSVDAQPSDQLKSALSGRGMWIQTPRTFTAARFDALPPIGVRRVHIMVTSDQGVSVNCARASTIKLKAVREVLAALIRASGERGLHVVATVYVRPRRDEIESLLGANGLLRWLTENGVSLIEFDLEGSWSKSKACGFATVQSAAAALIEGTRALPTSPNAGLTTHLGRASDPNLGMNLADWVSIQVYTKCTAAKCPNFDDKQEGPGHRQRRIPAVLAFKGPVIVGLAADSQKWAGHEIAEAMALALDAAKELSQKHPNFIGHSYWSSEWVFSPPEVRNFLSSTR